MLVNKKLRLNKFEPRPIVSNRELFVSNGKAPATVTSKDTADCYNQPTIEGATKTKMLGLASDIIAEAKKQHDSAGKAPHMELVNAKDK